MSKPQPADLFFCDSAREGVARIQLLADNERQEMLAAKSCDPASRVILMTDTGKVIGEAIYDSGWQYQQQLPAELPWDSVLNLMNWSDGATERVEQDVKRFGAVLNEVGNIRRIHFSASEFIEIRRLGQDSLEIRAQMGDRLFQMSVEIISETQDAGL
ncbi:MAG: hypothetical protein HWD83_03515 [Gammaproteobacteria bacterium]|nr:hypothetical protein [Gammaproteobacteria bacterium]